MKLPNVNTLIKNPYEIFPNINKDIEHALRYFSEPSKSLSNIIILTAGHEICEKTKLIIGPNKYNYNIIHYVYEGSGYIEYTNFQKEKVKIKVDKKQIFIISPKIEFTYYPDPDDPWEYYWISFFSEKDENLLSKYLNTDQYVIKLKNHVNVENAFKKIQRLPSYKFGKNFQALAIFFEAISEIIENSSLKVKSDNEKNHIKDCLQYINENYTNPNLSLIDIANYLYLNEKYLTRIFKACTGTTIFEYVNSLRIKTACFRLADTNESISTISCKVGYIDSLYFSKKFKKIIGVSPQVYRKYLHKKA